VAALLRAAQMAGAMQRALELAIEHANTRVQFGRAIGKFQAVQQMLAQLASHTAAAAAAVDLGADGLAAKDGLLEAAVAKSRAGEAAGIAAEISHQVIGAMGFTLEHPLHRYTRRLWSWRDEYGNEAFWNARLGEAAIGAGGSGAWSLIADRPWLSYGERL
jgi:acyl-CoA dehydrogenase